MERIAVFGAGTVRLAALSPDGLMAALAGSDNAIQLWSVQNGKPIATLSGPGKSVLSLQFSRDSKLLAAGADKALWLWDIATRKSHPLQDKALSSVEAASFSWDRRTLIRMPFRNPLPEQIRKRIAFSSLNRQGRRRIG
jgi:WD40 repeat protein